MGSNKKEIEDSVGEFPFWKANLTKTKPERKKSKKEMRQRGSYSQQRRRKKIRYLVFAL